MYQEAYLIVLVLLCVTALITVIKGFEYVQGARKKV
jgi:hypothetical protein